MLYVRPVEDKSHLEVEFWEKDEVWIAEGDTALVFSRYIMWDH